MLGPSGILALAACPNPLVAFSSARASARGGEAPRFTGFPAKWWLERPPESPRRRGKAVHRYSGFPLEGTPFASVSRHARCRGPGRR